MPVPGGCDKEKCGRAMSNTEALRTKNRVIGNVDLRVEFWHAATTIEPVRKTPTARSCPRTSPNNSGPGGDRY